MQKFFDKDELKSSLSLEDIFTLLSHFGGEPEIRNDDYIIAKTICHNGIGGGSNKLYYYSNTNLFKCFTNCDTFDVFELIVKIKAIEGIALSLPKAMEYVASFFDIEGKELDDREQSEDWKVLNRYRELSEIKIEEQQEIQLKIYDKNILKYYPHPRIIDWEDDGIKEEVMNFHNIAYNPVSGGILIPHYDINNNLIGIRERTLLEEQENWGKYRPSIIDDVMYSHPLSFNLYGLNQSKDNIVLAKTAIVVEAEKSVLQYESYFGIENSLICACCGSSLINYQVKLLLSLGIKEIIVGFDKDYIDKDDENFEKVVKKLQSIDKKYRNYVKISFLFDSEGDKLEYKNSPLDCGPDIFQELYEGRISL